MSYQLQQGAIAAELRKAGLPPDAANRIAAILGNAQQTSRTGPQVQDLTPAGLRYVTPATRKYQFSNLDFSAGDPDYRRPLNAATEERSAPVPVSTVQSAMSPQQTQASYRVNSGSYTDARPSGDAVQVGLRVQGTGKVLTLDPPSNSLIGKNVRAESDSSDNGRVRFFIEETGQELVWKLQLQNVYTQEIVTGISYVPGRGIVVTYATAALWSSPDSVRQDLIPETQIPVVTAVGLGAGLDYARTSVGVLSATDAGGGSIPVVSCDVSG
jgi:hypothetical protein